MTIDPLIFYIMSGGLVILVIALFAIVHLYSKLAKETHIEQKKHNDVALPAEQQATEIIIAAEKQAAKIIEKAEQDTIAIENSAHITNDQIRTQLDIKIKQ